MAFFARRRNHAERLWGLHVGRRRASSGNMPSDRIRAIDSTEKQLDIGVEQA
jgi:hypothetical protein